MMKSRRALSFVNMASMFSSSACVNGEKMISSTFFLYSGVSLTASLPLSVRWRELLLPLPESNMNPPSPKPVYEEFGELLFTHFGLSGPVILSASAHMEQGKRYLVSIDLKPALDEATLDARILRDFGDSKNRSFENAIAGLYPKTMIPVIVARSGIPGDTKVNAVTKEQRRALLTLTKHFTVQISGLRPVEEAIVTSGGVSVKEIDPKTMASKLVGGLYFAGEVMDVDAYTGGFNLQIAWATAYAAGTAAARSREA